MKDLILLLIGSVVMNNCVLQGYFGITSVLGNAKCPCKCVRLGLSVTVLMVLTMALAWPLQTYVLAPNGLYFQGLAAEDHLLGLKSIIYPELKLKEKDSVPELPGFSLLQSVPIRFTFTVEGAQVQNLLSMTPHVYRISKEGAARLADTETLTDTASCVLNIYRPTTGEYHA